MSGATSLWTSNGELLWETQHASTAPRNTIFVESGDGGEDVLVSDEQFVALLDGASGAPLWFAAGASFEPRFQSLVTSDDSSLEKREILPMLRPNARVISVHKGKGGDAAVCVRYVEDNKLIVAIATLDLHGEAVASGTEVHTGIALAGEEDEKLNVQLRTFPDAIVMWRDLPEQVVVIIVSERVALHVDVPSLLAGKGETVCDRIVVARTATMIMVDDDDDGINGR